MMRKKGQAAMEFLMTYGWAILVVLVVIGALAYFGVINPTMFLPDKCLIGTGLQCEQHLITVDDTSGVGNVKLQVRNSLGESISITSFNIYEDNVEIAVCTGVADAEGIVKKILNGGSANLEADCTLSGSVGEKLKYKVVVKYYKGGAKDFVHTLTGEVLTTLEETVVVAP